MSAKIEKELKRLEEKLWREFRAVLDIPEGVPAELRLDLLRETYEDIRQDAEFREMQEMFPGEFTTVGYCSGWCPECAIVRWCDFAGEQFSPEDMAWMAENKSYPPDFEFKL
jgi:hypothetical protein